MPMVTGFVQHFARSPSQCEKRKAYRLERKDKKLHL